MNEAFQIAATGLQAQQVQVRTLAGNLGNMATPGYKRVKLGFADLVGRALAPDATAPLDQGLNSAPAVPWPMGVMVASSVHSFEPGEFRKTGAALDVAIRGAGFLEVSNPDGSVAYWRGGTLLPGPDGQLTTRTGQTLRPGITIPENAQSLVIAPEGQVRFTVAGQTQAVEAGTLQMVQFTNPEALESAGDNLWRATEASGAARSQAPGDNGSGLLAQGYLEGSNVQMVDEMLGLVMAQNAYGACLKVVQAADEMTGLVNNLRR